MFRKILPGLLGALLVTMTAFAQDVELKADHPDRHVVVPGDTLWDISAKFLDSPWLWPEVWHVNPQIENPHLIYPGDIIELVYIDGKPRLQVQRGRRTVKMSPHVRAEQLDQAIPAIPIEAIRQFLDRTRVVDSGVLDSAPYIVDMDDHLIGGSGQRVYVRAIPEADPVKYSVFRAGNAYTDPGTGEVLGYEATFIADAQLRRTGDPATIELQDSAREALLGDRLLEPADQEFTQFYYPKAPSQPVSGQIISVVDGVSQIGQYQIVVLNLGEREGIEQGDVLRVNRAGDTVRDIIGGRAEMVTMPDELAGHLLVFAVYGKVSYGLIMEAQRPMNLNDVVTNP